MKNKKVLIIDDDTVIRKLYVPFFSKKGYDVVAAEGGTQGLEILKREKIDLIILDLAMPGMTGEDVLQKMLETPEWTGIPVVIDTAVSAASGRIEKIEKKYKNNMRICFFQRPTSLEELNTEIGKILGL